MQWIVLYSTVQQSTARCDTVPYMEYTKREGRKIMVGVAILLLHGPHKHSIDDTVQCTSIDGTEFPTLPTDERFQIFSTALYRVQ